MFTRPDFECFLDIMYIVNYKPVKLFCITVSKWLYQPSYIGIGTHTYPLNSLH